MFRRYEFCHLVIQSRTDTAKIRVFSRWKVTQSPSSAAELLTVDS